MKFFPITLRVLTLICLLGLTSCGSEMPPDVGIGSYDASPDGSKIVFSRVADHAASLFLFNVPTRRLTRLTTTKDYEDNPAFLPDGKSIVYTSAPSFDSSNHLFLRSLDGRTVRQLTKDRNVVESFPYFSADGEHVVFARLHTFRADGNHEKHWDGQDVYVVNMDGTGLRRLTHGEYGGYIRPKFSPDGEFVYFEETMPYPNIRMYISRIAASGVGPPERITHLGESDFFPYFFPDGQKIVFGSNSGGIFDLYEMPLTEGKATCLNTRQNGSPGIQPVVTADGKTIFYLADGIWKMDTDGAHKTKVVDARMTEKP